MSRAEPTRDPADPVVAVRMSRASKHGTAPELALRRELHRRGLRFRLQMPVPGSPRRTIDVALTRARIAVMVDGCFWHGCPQHEHRPRRNAVWWGCGQRSR